MYPQPLCVVCECSYMVGAQHPGVAWMLRVSADLVHPAPPTHPTPPPLHPKQHTFSLFMRACSSLHFGWLPCILLCCLQINSSIFNTGPVLVSLAAFGVYAALGHPLTAAVAFPSLALFNLLRFPIVMIPQQIMNLIAATVGITRIQRWGYRPTALALTSTLHAHTDSTHDSMCRPTGSCTRLCSHVQPLLCAHMLPCVLVALLAITPLCHMEWLHRKSLQMRCTAAWLPCRGVVTWIRPLHIARWRGLL